MGFGVQFWNFELWKLSIRVLSLELSFEVWDFVYGVSGMGFGVSNFGF